MRFNPPSDYRNLRFKFILSADALTNLLHNITIIEMCFIFNATDEHLKFRLSESSTPNPALCQRIPRVWRTDRRTTTRVNEWRRPPPCRQWHMAVGAYCWPTTDVDTVYLLYIYEFIVPSGPLNVTTAYNC